MSTINLLRWTRPGAILFLCVIALAYANTGGAAGDGDRIHWKQLTNSQVKLDGKTPLSWNLYQPDKSHKKSNVVLVLLGHRYLAVDFRLKVVYQVPPTDLQPQGNDFESGDLFKQDRVVPSDTWTVRDVGPAEMIRFRLNDYGREVELLLRHTPDLRAFY
jgi:hypothetical protein